jgi:hypothetical protein
MLVGMFDSWNILEVHNSLCVQAIKSHHVALLHCADLAGRWLFLAIWSHLHHFSHCLAQRGKAIRWLLVALHTLSNIVHLVCIMFLQASSRMYILFLYIAERGAHAIFTHVKSDQHSHTANIDNQVVLPSVRYQ